MPRILLIDDDKAIAGAIEKNFTLEPGLVVKSISNGSQAVCEAVNYRPELILLEVELPGCDGRQVIKSLKENAATKQIPVIFLSRLSSEGDRVLGLQLGADDYVVKPFGMMELLARIQAVLRRTYMRTTPKDVIRVGHLKLDRNSRLSTWRGKRVNLQPREFEVLYLLASQPGRTLGRSYLIENTSSYGLEVCTRSLDTHIKNLRKKLVSGDRWIQTVPKLGYRFELAA